ncbi:unnamed protein product [Paramecium sonneborni]|uniref:Uncharacterized protein n=1 Tax=Paramecium sonneborni TaxID=65129 RepID=A0A8S1PM72_9CILI|nr:unnamed protein product [Paramecium sonneborni]
MKGEKNDCAKQKMKQDQAKVEEIPDQEKKQAIQPSKQIKKLKNK